MGKKKKASTEKESKPYLNEVYAIVLILIAILGYLSNSGPIGKFIKSFAIFLVGSSEGILLFIIFLLGIYIFFKRDKLDIYSTRWIGFVLIVVAALTLLHMEYINTIDSANMSKIISATVKNLTSAIDKIIHTNVSIDTSNLGGGILGAIFSSISYTLFKESSIIVTWVIAIIGLIIFTGVSVMDILNKVCNKGKKIMPFKHEESGIKESKPLIVDNNHHDDDATKRVVKNIEELEKISSESPKEEPAMEQVPTNKDYHLPSLSLLEWPNKSKVPLDEGGINKNIEILEKTLYEFGIVGKVVEVNVGPTVTQYEMEIKSGTKVSKLLGINREIALALGKKTVLIQAPIPGKRTIGIEIPNDHNQPVSLREILNNMPKKYDNSKLAVALGKNIMGRCEYAELDTMPHLLVAGTTGSGKSVCINCMIISLLMRTKPNEVKLVLVDPKKVELSVYNGVPHLLAPVVSDPKKASEALKKIVSEMERRYELFSECGTKNINSYNEMIETKNKKLSEDEKMNKMPYIVVIIDELADLMLVAAKEVEDSIMRITQMARAAGIHLIVATQRPSTDIITGLIKANIPSRIAFSVSSSIDSRTILDMMGAEKLLGKGDMLFLPIGESTPVRIQGAFISEKEIQKVVDHTVQEQKAQYDDKFMNLDNNTGNTNSGVIDEPDEYDDPLYMEIVEFVITTGKVSASLLQRKYRLGYNRAARIVDLLEERGIIGPANGSKPREVLVKLENKE